MGHFCMQNAVLRGTTSYSQLLKTGDGQIEVDVLAEEAHRIGITVIEVSEGLTLKGKPPIPREHYFLIRKALSMRTYLKFTLDFAH